jgi:release factor glutamine methyltransferase
VVASELESEPLRWARRNRNRLGLASVALVQGSLLDPVLADRTVRDVDVVLGNVPFVLPSDFAGEEDAPDVAYLGAGADGLDLHRTLARQATEVLRPGGWLMLQLTEDRWGTFAAELLALGYVDPRSVASRSAVIGSVRWPGPEPGSDTA